MTLIEMLIVLVIIGVDGGRGVARHRRGDARAFGRDRGAAARGAATGGGDDAMLGDRMIAFTVEKHGYGFADGADGVRPRAPTPRSAFTNCRAAW
jgi:general secretion pathway protein H